MADETTPLDPFSIYALPGEEPGDTVARGRTLARSAGCAVIRIPLTNPQGVQPCRTSLNVRPNSFTTW
jgi:hypothetical protein